MKHASCLKNRNLAFLIWDILFVFLFITGFVCQHTMIDIIALLSFCVYSLIMILSTNLKALKFSYLFVLYAVFIFVCYLGFKFGNIVNKDATYEMLKTLLRDFIFLIFLYIYICNRGVDHFKNLFIFLSVLTSVIFLFYVFVSTGTIVIRDLEGIGIYNGNGLAICDALAVCLIFTDIKKIGLKSIFYLFVLFVFIVLSGTRKAILGVAIGLVVGLYLSFPKKIVRNLIITAIILTALYFILMKIPTVYNILGVRIENVINYILEGSVGDASMKSRISYIELGFEMFKKNSVWGIGLNGFSSLKGSFGRYSHNNYIELLCDTGLTGTISYYLMHLSILIGAMIVYFKGERRYAVYALIIIVNVIVLDYATVTYYERVNLIYLALCAIMITEGSEKRKNGS